MSYLIGSRKGWEVLRTVPPLSVTPLPLCKNRPKETLAQPQPSLENLIAVLLCRKYPQYCWEFHDWLWEALSGTTFEERGVPSRYWAVLGGGENSGNALEPSNALNYRAWGIPAVLSRGIPGNTLRAEFPPESPSRTEGVAYYGHPNWHWIECISNDYIHTHIYICMPES